MIDNRARNLMLLFAGILAFLLGAKPSIAQDAQPDELFGDRDPRPARTVVGGGEKKISGTTAADAPPDVKPEAAAGAASDGADPGEPSRQEPKIDPRLLRLQMMDGSIVIGKPTIEAFEVSTEFGQLVVPIERLKEFKPGLESHSTVFTRLRTLIDELGSGDYKQRDTAQKELLAMGTSIRGELSRHLDDENAERARRVKQVLTRLNEIAEEEQDFAAAQSQENLWKRGDTVETSLFTVIGDMTPSDFKVESKYGMLQVSLADIKSAKRLAGQQREPIRKTLAVEGTYLAQQKYKSAGLRVQKGDRITVEASGRINRSNSSSYVSGPEGSSRFGTFMQNPAIQGGTLVAKIGNGDVIKIGRKEGFVAKKSGVLRFAIGMRPDYVGRYQFIGKYDLKVHVKPGE